MDWGKNLPKRILVVEDHENTRALYAEELQEAGYEVLTAENGYLAMKIIEKDRVDLVITDLRMPEVSGVTLIHCIHFHDEKIPVVVVSAYRQYEEPLAGNIRAFFTKPVNLELLKQCVAELFLDKTGPAKTFTPPRAPLRK